MKTTSIAIPQKLILAKPASHSSTKKLLNSLPSFENGSGAIGRLSRRFEKVLSQLESVDSASERTQLSAELTELFARLLEILSGKSSGIAAVSSGSLAKRGIVSHGPSVPSNTLLWKPQSESDGNLVVLLPSSMSNIQSVKVLDPSSGQVLAEGRYSGRANGQRAHFRFSQSGGEFPAGAILEVVSSQGVQRIPVQETGARFERS